MNKNRQIILGLWWLVVSWFACSIFIHCQEELYVEVCCDGVPVTGSVYQNSPSQILPASYLSIGISRYAFMTASNTNPVLIEIQLPPGAVLSQTLADGDVNTACPLPTNGETVFPLAMAVSSGTITGMNYNAVQLFRYVAGEDVIQIRITESTLNWYFAPEFAFFTIGVGKGVLPNTANTNWGTGGIHNQKSTLFFADLRNYSFFINENRFPVHIGAFTQYNHSPVTVIQNVETVSLFTLNQLLPGTPPALSFVDNRITDISPIDINQDGIPDICMVDRSQNRLYWALGNGNGTFGDLGEMPLTTGPPKTVGIADVDGDCYPDLLICDELGYLNIFYGRRIFSAKADWSKVALPDKLIRLTSGGVISSAAVVDVNNDGKSDLVYADGTYSTLNVSFGNSFTNIDTYSSGSVPIALATGDFNGDNVADVVLANQGTSSLSVYLNNGLGVFTRNDVASIGQFPVSLTSADYDKDGKDDIAVALQSDRSVAIFTAQSGGLFNNSHRQKVYFQPTQTPSALQSENIDGLNGPDILVGFSDWNKIAVITLDPSDSQFKHSFNLDPTGDVQVDPFNHTTISSDKVVVVASGGSAGGASSTQGIIGITQYPINLLHFPRSKNISFSMVNLASNPAIMNLELIDNDGKYKNKGTSISVASRSQYPHYFTDILGSDADNAQRWVRVFTTQQETYGLWLYNDTALSYMDGFKAPDIRDSIPNFIFPMLYAASGKFSSCTIINPTTNQAHAVLKLVSSTGSLKSTYSFLLEGRGRVELDLADIFPSLAGTDSILVNADRGLIGMEMFGWNTKDLACLSGIPLAADTSPLYCPHFACGNFGGIQYESILSLVNSSATQVATIIITLYNDSGVAQGNRTISNIPAQGKHLLNIANLFNLTTPTTGYLKIDRTNGSGIVGSITFGDATNGKFLSSLPLLSASNDHFIMGHIANGTIGAVSFFTGITILNPGADSKSVRVTAYNSSGQTIKTKTISLSPRTRTVSLINQLFPLFPDIAGGYILIDNLSTQNGLLVFELFGNQQFSFLSAVPAVPVNQ